MLNYCRDLLNHLEEGMLGYKPLIAKKLRSLQSKVEKRIYELQVSQIFLYFLILNWKLRYDEEVKVFLVAIATLMTLLVMSQWTVTPDISITRELRCHLPCSGRSTISITEIERFTQKLQYNLGRIQNAVTCGLLKLSEYTFQQMEVKIILTPINDWTAN